MPDEEHIGDDLDDFYGEEGAAPIRAAIDARFKAQEKLSPPDEHRAAVAAAESEENAVLDRIVGPVETDDDDEYDAGLGDVDVSDDAVFAALDSGDDAQVRLIKRAQEYVRDQDDLLDGKVGV